MGKVSANIVAATACAIWTLFFVMGRGLTLHIYEQGPGIHPNAGQIDFYIMAPFAVAFSVSLVAWLINALQRAYWLLSTFSAVTLLALVPFVLGYGGGV